MAGRNLVRGALARDPKHVRNGLKSYVHALHKWNICPTVKGPYCTVKKASHQAKFDGKVGGRTSLRQHVLAKKDASGQTGEVPAEDIENNAEYLATVGIGTPPQNVALDFDTDLWVTFKKSSRDSWQIQYGDGSSASGDVGTDTVTVGGLSVEKQAIELAKTLSTQFQQGPGDGLLGLSFGSVNTVQPAAVKAIVENMIAQQDIPKNTELFTAYLGSTPPASSTSTGSSAATEESFYTFGYVDTTASNGQEPIYTPADSSQGFCTFDSTSAKVGNKTIQRTGNTAIADTGTTLALVGDDLCEAVYGAIPGAKMNTEQQGWVFPPNTDLSTLPAVQVAVGDSLFTINPEELPFQDLGDGTYYGGIQSRGDQGFDILGDVFLRCVYAIFDQGNTRFGVTQRASTLTGQTTAGATSCSGRRAHLANIYL